MPRHRRKNKFGNIKKEVDGILFHSTKEANRYSVLKLMEMAGEINELELQPAFPITVNGFKICTYKADFRYISQGKSIIEDVKGVRTALYVLKKKLVEALYPGVKVTEV